MLLQYQEVLPSLFGPEALLSECVLALRVISYLYIDGSGTCPLPLLPYAHIVGFERYGIALKRPCR